jgi:RimJ/RimL family protein N-acetyltransferase
MHNMPGTADQPSHRVAAGQAGRGFGTAAARAMTRVALALPGAHRAEIHCDQANAASVAIARKLGYRLDRIERCRPGAPGESGRLMVWVMVP